MSEEKFLRPWMIWLIGGAALGVLMRVLFGALPSRVSGLMSIAFLVGTPTVVGAITVYGARHASASWAFAIFAPWGTVLLMLLGCAITLLEGSICIALLTPLFLVCASVGGVAMECALRATKTHQSQLKAVALLPLLILVAESGVDHRTQSRELRSSILIDAPPATVWNEILTARAIQPAELPFSLTHLIGVPRPVEGINVPSPEGEVRYSKWERGVNFRAAVTKRVEQQSITWRYHFDEQSFPPGAMDEHVAIGGRYFDIGDTTFNLRPLPGERTELEIVAHYRVTTRINFYAVPAATILGKDFMATLLGFYKGRSERS
ncbi:SRPBCC family protein [Peristeroidobacter agariperforans]|uniref:SRPBCC family protein n=1 Tax=Peristeroidobacter agariperforans TaxID=268404 RepID=UPI00101BF5DD|nr:SRPBCC family protein [Peristeroidobacter agariperforans]